MAELLAGYKTHIIGAAAIVVGIGGYLVKVWDADTAAQLTLLGLAAMGLRLGIKKGEVE